ncbi:hypothetical protein J0H58_00190 [bacterium]|nr:hypothetical protein [bacterium]
MTVAAYLLVDSPDGPQHTDVSYNYVDERWVLNVHTDAAFGPGGAFGGGGHSTVLDADEGLLFPAPNTPEGDQIYLGFSTEQTPHDTFATFIASDARVAGQNAEWMVLELVGFSGPGQFSLMEFGSFGELRLTADPALCLTPAANRFLVSHSASCGQRR